MTWIEPNARFDDTALEDETIYTLTLTSVEPHVTFENSKFPGENTTFKFTIDELPDLGERWITAGNRIGMSKQTGLPSKLARVLNALNGRDQKTFIEAVDADTLACRYDGVVVEPPVIGTKVRARGYRDADSNFRWESFAPPRPTAGAGVATAAAAPKAAPRAAVSPDAVPF